MSPKSDSTSLNSHCFSFLPDFDCDYTVVITYSPLGLELELATTPCSTDEVLDLEDLELEKMYFPTANSTNKYRYVEYISAPNARFDSTLLQVPGEKCSLPNNL